MDADQIILKTSQRHLNNFIWRYKPAKVKHLAITRTTEETDLGNIYIESQAKALRIPWLNHILLSKGWADIAKIHFDKIGGLKFVLRCDYNVECFPDLPPLFYSNMLRYTKEILKCNQGDQILRNNKNITIEGKSLYYKEWHQRGIVYIQGLFDHNGIYLNFETYRTKFTIRTNFLSYFGVIDILVL